MFKSIGKLGMILFTLEHYHVISSFLQLIKLPRKLFSEPAQRVLHLLNSDLILHLPLDPGKNLTPHGFYVHLKPFTTRLHALILPLEDFLDGAGRALLEEVPDLVQVISSLFDHELVRVFHFGKLPSEVIELAQAKIVLL
jgi:hypothetical protein